MDTAYAYGPLHLFRSLTLADASQGTEGAVGAAIRESGIPREEIFVTTKLSYVDSVERVVDIGLFRIIQLAPPRPSEGVDCRKFGECRVRLL